MLIAPTREPRADELTSNGCFLSGTVGAIGYTFRFHDGYFTFDDHSLVRAPSIDISMMIYVLNPVEINGKLREPGWYDYYKGPMVSEDGVEADRLTPSNTPYSVMFSSEDFERLEKAPFAYEVLRKTEIEI